MGQGVGGMHLCHLPDALGNCRVCYFQNGEKQEGTRKEWNGSVKMKQEKLQDIVTPGCLGGYLTIADIQIGATFQRNPLIAEFCRKTMIFRPNSPTQKYRLTEKGKKVKEYLQIKS